jgi:uncharacterized membrane protein YuzA (DUF378 family)
MEERRLNALDWIALALLIIGGLNWLLVGLFRFDLVAAVFGGQTAIVSRIVYTLVGISAIYVAIDAFSFEKRPAHAGGAGMTRA